MRTDIDTSPASRRAALQRLAALTATALTTALMPSLAQAQGQRPRVEVWKDPNCGCCAEWVTHLRDNGFEVSVNDSGNTAMRQRLGIATKYGSCHTARVGGYAIEGHVPAREVHRLLRERPAALGLAVPRMPVGSPGMDGPEYEGRRDPYDVLLLQPGGGATVFQAYR